MMNRKAIVVGMVFAGVWYGLLSAQMNRNPHYEGVGGYSAYTAAGKTAAWYWEPSAGWLPSYLLHKVAKYTGGNWAGVSYTKSGYVIRTGTDMVLFFVGSGFVGAIMMWLLGIGVGAVLDRVYGGKEPEGDRKKSHHPPAR